VSDPSLAGAAVRSGGQIAGYRIRSVIGVGGMGTVYLADRPGGGACALKVLSPRVVPDDGSFAIRFRREAKYAESLDHPHILELHDTGETPDGTQYIAMQYVPGPDLGALLARGGPLGLRAAVDILGQVAGALDAAHAAGLIHRDVKPGNILVAEDPGGVQAFLTDFGLSKNPDADSVALTRQGQLVGTMAYTAPEEILAQPRGSLVDIYSLGCVLYESLTGTPPFVREHALEVLYAHIGDPRPKVTERQLDLPPEIDAVVARAMAIAPEERYPTCGALIAAAGALLPDWAPPPEGPALAASEARTPLPPTSEPPAAGPLRLRVREGKGLGAEVHVDDELVIGRMTTLDGALAGDRGISRRHGVLRREPDGGLVVEDAYSANGTWVNGERIEGPRSLAAGDELQLGATAFVVTADEPGTAAPAPVPDRPESAPPAGRRGAVSLSLDLDLDAGEIAITIDDGPTTRIVRDGDSWRVDGVA
jgi:hypothetical protein